MKAGGKREHSLLPYIICIASFAISARLGAYDDALAGLGVPVWAAGPLVPGRRHIDKKMRHMISSFVRVSSWLKSEHRY